MTEPDEKQVGPGLPRLTVPFRGQMVEMFSLINFAGMRVGAEQVIPILFMSLLALEDPRIDAIFQAYGITLHDCHDNLIYPEHSNRAPSILTVTNCPMCGDHYRSHRQHVHCPHDKLEGDRDARTTEDDIRDGVLR